MQKNIIGQWVGYIEGTNNGYIVLNIETEDGSAIAMISENRTDINFPNYWATVKLTLEGKTITGKIIEFVLFDRLLNVLTSEEEIKKRIPDFKMRHIQLFNATLAVFVKIS